MSEIVLLEYISATSGNPMHVVAERWSLMKHSQFHFINSKGEKTIFNMVDGATTLEQQRKKFMKISLRARGVPVQSCCVSYLVKVGTFVRCHGWVGEKPPSPGVPHRKKKDVEEGEGWVV